MKRLLVILSVLVCMMAPRVALADEVDILGGFTSGISDFASDEVKDVSVTPESDFDDEYEPVLRDAGTVEVEDVGVFASIQSWVMSLKAPWGNTAGYAPNVWSSWVRTIFVAGITDYPLTSLAGTAAILVFLWWGVRKAVRMIFAAFRGGKASL